MPKKNSATLRFFGGGRNTINTREKLTARLGIGDWSDGHKMGAVSDLMQKETTAAARSTEYARAMLEEAKQARFLSRPKMAKAYERFAKNNGATTAQLKEYRSDLRAEGLSVG